MPLPAPLTLAQLEEMRQKAAQPKPATPAQEELAHEITADSTDAQLQAKAKRFGYLVGIANVDWLAHVVFTQAREIKRLNRRLERLESAVHVNPVEAQIEKR